jgi:hypothetical protein
MHPVGSWLMWGKPGRSGARSNLTYRGQVLETDMDRCTVRAHFFGKANLGSWQISVTHSYLKVCKAQRLTPKEAHKLEVKMLMEAL